MNKNKKVFSYMVDAWNTAQGNNPAYECFRQALSQYGFDISYEDLMGSLPEEDDKVFDNFKYLASKYKLRLDKKEGKFEDFTHALSQNKIIIFSWRFENLEEDEIVHLCDGMDHYFFVHEADDQIMVFSGPENTYPQFFDKEFSYSIYSGVLEDFTKIGKIIIIEQYCLHNQ